MLNCTAKKSNDLQQTLHGAYYSKCRRAVCIATGLTAIICSISLQFCCEFIDSNRPNILLIRSTARLIKFPFSILFIFVSAFNIYDLINKYKKSGSKEEAAKIVGKLAFLTHHIIDMLTQIKIIDFLAANSVNHFKFASTSLFLFVSEPISYYNTCKKHQSKKNTKELITNTITLSLNLAKFIVDRLNLPILPINLGNGLIYNFSLATTLGIILSAMYLMSHVEKLLYYDVNQSSLDGIDVVHHHSNNDNHISDNHTIIEM